MAGWRLLFTVVGVDWLDRMYSHLRKLAYENFI